MIHQIMKINNLDIILYNKLMKVKVLKQIKLYNNLFKQTKINNKIFYIYNDQIQIYKIKYKEIFHYNKYYNKFKSLYKTIQINNNNFF